MVETQRLAGPYVNAALLCDQVIEEKDGRLSLFRLLTEVTVAVAGEDPPAEMPPTEIPLTGLVTFNAGGCPGDYRVALLIEDPEGVKRVGPDLPMHLTHDHYTMNLIVKATLRADMPGLYWILVMLDEREATKLPLLVRYVPKRTGKPKPVSDGGENEKSVTR